MEILNSKFIPLMIAKYEKPDTDTASQNDRVIFSAYKKHVQKIQ